MGWQVEDYSIELDDSDRSLIRIIYDDQVGWIRTLESPNSKYSIHFLDHYFRLYTGALHFEKSVNRFCQIIEDCKSTLLVDSFQGYMLEMNGDKVKKSLNKEKMLLVIRLWMIHQGIQEDMVLKEMALVDFMFTILEDNPYKQTKIVVENRSDFQSFIKCYVLR